MLLHPIFYLILRFGRFDEWEVGELLGEIVPRHRLSAEHLVEVSDHLRAELNRFTNLSADMLF